VHAATALALQAIVPDAGCGAQRLLNVTCFENIGFAVGVICPQPRETISLQLWAHGQLILLRLADLPLLCVNLRAVPPSLHRA
jgi:hypothetical protein